MAKKKVGDGSMEAADPQARRRSGRDAGKLVQAELALDRWLSRLTRAAREVRRLGKRVKYYRNKCAFTGEKITGGE